MKVISINLTNGGLTEYDNFNFNSMCVFNGQVLMASESGLTILAGTDDKGTEIISTMQTGLADFGTSLGKGISNVYLGAKSDSPITITAITDGDNQRFPRTVSNQSGTIGELRSRYPYSFLSRYWGFIISGTNLTIDQVRVEPGTQQSY